MQASTQSIGRIPIFKMKITIFVRYMLQSKYLKVTLLFHSLWYINHIFHFVGL